MVTRGVVRFVVLLAMVATGALFWGVGCSSDDTGTGDDGGGGGVSADSLVLLANDSLGSLMSEMINETLDNPDTSLRPNDIDFTGAYQLYQRALAADPTNQDARFGAAMCALMTFLADDDFNTFYDDVVDFADTIDFGPLAMIPTATLGTSMLFTGLPMTVGGLTRLNVDPMMLDKRIATAASQATPRLSDLQSAFQNTLLPLIVETQFHLTALIADTSYRFYITPEMQGNPGADPIEVDNVDFRVFLTATYALESAVDIFLARNLDIQTYDLNGAVIALDKNDNFLGLRPGGFLGQAYLNLQAALNQASTAVDALITEINSGENQDDDLISADPDDIQDLLLIKDTILAYYDKLQGPSTVTLVIDRYLVCEDFGGYFYCYWEEETADFTVDIRQWFINPLDNLKDFLPDYFLGLDTLSLVNGEYEICLIWATGSFDTWVFPYPTINGVLPGIDSDSLKSLFGIDAGTWSQEICDTIRF